MAVSNSLVKKEQTQAVSKSFSGFITSPAIKQRINQMMNEKEGILFTTSIVAAVTANPKLQECENMTIVSAGLLGAALKLNPSPQLGHFYMVPYDNKKKGVKEAQFQLGYKGYIQLAIRSGFYKKLNVVPIKQGEYISWNPFTETLEYSIIEDEKVRAETPTIGYYAMFEYINGFVKAMYWSKEKMQYHADKYSPAYSLKKDELLKAGQIPQSELWKYSSFWYNDFDAMACKTMLRQIISKWGIMSTDMQQAYENDKDVPLVNDENTIDAKHTVVTEQGQEGAAQTAQEFDEAAAALFG